MITAMENQSIPQHSLLRSFILHVAPGTMVAIAFYLLNSFLGRSDYPPLLAFLLAVLLVDIPFMLVTMLSEGKKLNGKYSLEGVILYRERVSWKTFLVLFAGTFLLTFLLLNMTSPLTGILKDSLFSSIPQWVDMEEQTQYVAYPRNVLLFVFTLQLIVTGVALPWIEELYFRGYLMPRVNRFGNLTPLLGGLFFSLYHVWQLFGFSTVFVLGVVLGYLVWWKKDIRLSISLHVFANFLARLMFLAAALAL